MAEIQTLACREFLREFRTKALMYRLESVRLSGPDRIYLPAATG